MSVTILQFEDRHHAAAVKFWQETPGIGLSEADSPEGISRFLRRNPGLSFVACDGEVMVGTVLCGHDSRRGLIHHLAVREGYRGQGLGRELMKRCLDGLRREGVEKCHLFVYKDNLKAQEFWKRLGAEDRVTLKLYSITC